MNIKNITQDELAANGHTGKFPNRGYSVITKDEKLMIFRKFNTSWFKAFKSAIQAYNDDRHL